MPAAAGGALGVVVASIATRAFATLAPPPGAMPMIDVRLDGRILADAAFISVASALLFGIVPALAGTRQDVSESRTGRWREALVAAQIAITLVLLIGAGLLTRTFLAIITHDVQFNPDRLLTFQLNVPLGEFMERRGAVGDRPYFQIIRPPSLMFQRVHEALRAVPGVRAVAGTSVPIVNALVHPTTAVQAHSWSTDGREPPPGPNAEPISAAYFFVTPEFLTTIGARLLRGRDLEARDAGSSRWVVVVNDTAARTLWPGVDPIGRQIALIDVPEDRPREVIGVISDIPLTLPEESARPVIYMSYLQQPDWYPLPGANLLGQMMFMIRTAGDPLALLPAARQVVAAIDPDRPISNVSTMEEQLRARVPRRADYLAIIGAFACAATLLASTASCRTPPRCAHARSACVWRSAHARTTSFVWWAAVPRCWSP